MQLINWPEREEKGIKKIIKKIIRKIRNEEDIYDLINKGMHVGKNFWCGDSCSFDMSFCYLIEIGNNVTFSNRVQIITHDSSLHDFIHRTKLGLVKIDDYAFIGALVVKSVPDGEVWGGHPAIKICDRSQLEEKFNSNEYKLFDKEYLDADEKKQKEIRDELIKKKRCYIV